MTSIRELLYQLRPDPQWTPRTRLRRPLPARNGTAPIGTVNGMPVRAHWSVAVVAVLLATEILARLGRTGGPAAAAALCGAALLLLSLLVRELAQALTGRLRGRRVRLVTLWLFGGGTEFHGEPTDPTSELVIAMAGPLASAFTGLVFAAGAWATAGAHGPRRAVAVLVWLAGANGLMTVVNLLPGAPLDGGRVLRTLLRLRYGDAARAASGAAACGLGLGFAFVGTGLVEAVRANTWTSVWLLVAGGFLMNAAETERVRTTQQQHRQPRKEMSTMRALVVVESMFGNSRRIADAIAEGIDSHLDTTVVNVGGAPAHLAQDIGLLVVGGPTHALSMSRPATRQDAARQAPDVPVPTGAGIREWLQSLQLDQPAAAAAFDTRVQKPRWLSGSAAKSAQRELRRLHLRIVLPANSFYVTGTRGPLLVGELERAHSWGAQLAATFATTR